MYRHGYYQCSLYVMFFNIKIDLYFCFGLNSPLLQSPPNFWDLFLALRVERRGKKGEEKRRRPTCGETYYVCSMWLPLCGPPDRQKDQLLCLPPKSLWKDTIKEVRSLYSRLKLGAPKNKWPILIWLIYVPINSTNGEHKLPSLSSHNATLI